nr:ribosome small subunit-dependent GTPase A [Bacillus horti]
MHLGLNNEFQDLATPFIEQGFSLGRVALEHKHIYRIYTEHGELLAEIAGKLRFEAQGIEDFPAVGDWVAIKPRAEEGKATIHAVLPRKSKFSRNNAGMTTEEQIVATNVDYVFLVTALNNDFNIRRLERYLIMAWESGATPVIILSKADLCSDVQDKLAAVESIAIGVPVHILSSVTKEGIEDIAQYVKPGITAALLGSSGVGKSTLINQLYGEDIQKVNDIRQGDDRGKHTTTHRELIILPSGGIIIDTHGMRELQLWEGGQGFTESFKDIEDLARECRFTDCTHKNEPHCAVKLAIEEGRLDAERFTSYLKTQRELQYLERKEKLKARADHKKAMKKK